MEEARVSGRSVVVAMRVIIITVLLICGLAVSEQRRGLRERTIEEVESDRVGRGSRDRRALGILLQGLMEALGYTALGPVRFASIPNPTPAAAQTPVPSLLPPPPGMLQRNNSSTTLGGPPPPAAAAARETLRLTGVLNFGNNANASNLMNHLAQYERIFHGSTTTSTTSSSSTSPMTTMTTARPSTSSGPSSQQPLLVKIPIPHRSHQTTSSYDDDDDEGSNSSGGSSSSSSSSEESSGEYRESSAESSDSEEADGVELSPPPPPPSKPKMSVEREYRKQQKVVSFASEDREVNDPPPPHPSGGADSRYNHAMYVGEPDWKQRYEEQAYQLAAKHEALAEELSEKNAQREQEQQCYGERQELVADNHHDVDDEEQKDDSREDERPGGKILLEQRKRLNKQLANRLESREPIKLRDSYGKSLVKADGKMDERIAAYLGMFKNPRTGVYDPDMIETYEHARKYGELEERPPPKKETKQSSRVLGGGGGDLRAENKYEEYLVSNKLANKRRPPRKYWPPSDSTSSPLNEFKRNSHRLSLDTIEGTPTTEASMLAKYYDGFLDYGPYYAAIDDQFYRPPSLLPPPPPPPPPTPTTTTTTRATRTRTTRNNGDIERVVARLASYNNSFIKQFEGTTSVVDPAFANALPQPERPIARDFLDDFRSWPQPYANTFVNDDAGEKSQIVAAQDTATNRPSVSQALYKPSAPTCKDGNKRSQSRIKDSRSDRFRDLNNSDARGRPESCREDGRAKQVEGKATTG